MGRLGICCYCSALLPPLRARTAADLADIFFWESVAFLIGGESWGKRDFFGRLSAWPQSAFIFTRQNSSSEGFLMNFVWPNICSTLHLFGYRVLLVENGIGTLWERPSVIGGCLWVEPAPFPDAVLVKDHWPPIGHLSVIFPSSVNFQFWTSCLSMNWVNLLCARNVANLGCELRRKNCNWFSKHEISSSSASIC